MGGESVKGFFLLNEGNMGSNKSTIDFFSYETGKYLRNIYPTRNPGVVKELGDVGNDIAIHGDKLYAVLTLAERPVLGRAIQFRANNLEDALSLIVCQDKAFFLPEAYAILSCDDLGFAHVGNEFHAVCAIVIKSLRQAGELV